MPEWTVQQKKAIESRGGTILVSAAAGSGKTAVLVERIIRRLSDIDNPLFADKLLIVTFTRAAAAEMKLKIQKAIRKAIRNSEADVKVKQLLKKQEVLLQQANISTVDSFCVKLTREFFYKLGINENYKILDEKQGENLRIQALDEVVEAYLSNSDTLLADVFSDDRNDKALKAAIEKLYNYTRSHLFPEKWINDTLSFYENISSVEETIWCKKIIQTARESLDYCLRASDRGLEIISTEYLSNKLSDLFVDLRDSINDVLERIDSLKWDEIISALSHIPFPRYPSIRGVSEDPTYQKVKKLHDDIKEMITKKLIPMFVDNSETIKEDISKIFVLYKKLSELVTQFSDRYNQLKTEINSADYNDIEHWAVKLFINPDKTKTVLAEELSERFDEIMIDEYQDTNEVQDEIFKALAKSGDTNRFMVGDIKQSIYGFRLAMPEIFLKYKRNFNDSDDGKYPKVINLDKNFRSSPEVIDTVNYFFGLLMSEETGGVRYRHEEKLNLGRDTEVNDRNNTELLLLNHGNMDKVEAEAFVIAQKIKEIINSGYEVMDGDGYRKIEYKDFCILMRSANKTAYQYAKILTENGVPAHATVSQNFFEEPEIRVILSLLRVIDNPNQDIPLLAVLFSPLFDYTADDISKLRIENRNDSIYTAIIKDENNTFSIFLKKLDDFRKAASVMPAPVFISYLLEQLDYYNISAVISKKGDSTENLKLLIQYAKVFEESGNIGLGGFIRFIDKLESNNSTLASANTLSENENVVKIMTIHKSKGLEFPVCIIADCARRFKLDKDSVALNMDYGFGCRILDKEFNVTYSNVVKEAISKQNKYNELTEELRVLYVAMTRAREKLILVSTVDKLNGKITKKELLAGSEDIIPPYAVLNVSSALDWLLMCAVRHPYGSELRELDGIKSYTPAPDSVYPWKIKCIDVEELINENCIDSQEVNVSNTEIDYDLLSRIKFDTTFRYPAANDNLPVKITASSLSENNADEISLKRPNFMMKKGLSAAERGTAFHSYLQFCDFDKAATAPDEELKRLISEGFITQEQGSSINLNLVRKFLGSSIGREVLSADKVEREYRFSVCLNTNELPKNLNADFENSEKSLILQGAIDLFYIKGDRVVLLDFKTDNVNSADTLRDRYISQIELYKTALEKILGMKVSKSIIYSLRLGDYVEI